MILCSAPDKNVFIVLVLRTKIKLVSPTQQENTFLRFENMRFLFALTHVYTCGVCGIWNQCLRPNANEPRDKVTSETVVPVVHTPPSSMFWKGQKRFNFYGDLAHIKHTLKKNQVELFAQLFIRKEEKRRLEQNEQKSGSQKERKKMYERSLSSKHFWCVWWWQRRRRRRQFIHAHMPRTKAKELVEVTTPTPFRFFLEATTHTVV